MSQDARKPRQSPNWWRRHPFARRSIRVVAAIAVGALVALGWYQVSVEPGAGILRSVFEAKPEVTPPTGFADIRNQVRTWPTVAVPTPDAPDAHLVVYTPDSTAPAPDRPVVLWIHGGGFISSSTATVADFAILLAHAGYAVASLEYSLAPAHRYPTPVRQANAALGYLERHAADYGGDAADVVVGGDSAGAQIASQLAAVQTNPTLAASMKLDPAIGPGALRGVVLYCGLYDLDTVADTGFPGLRTYLWSYLGQRDWQSAPHLDELSTVRNVTADYPPAFITVGDVDPFAGQAAELIDALGSAGVPVDGLLWTGSGDGLGHEYQFDYARAQAQVALSRTLAFLEGVTG